MDREGSMKRIWTLTLASLLLFPPLALGAPGSAPEPRLHPREVSALPSFVRRVEPSVVALHVQNAEKATSSARLGSRRFGSGGIFDQRVYVVTVSYLLLDAVSIEAKGRDGRAVPARVVGLDLDTGLGVVKLEGAGRGAGAALGASPAGARRG